MNNIPKIIYLNLGPDGQSAPDFDELSAVTWCRDRIDPGDIEYVRAKRHKLPWVQSLGPYYWACAETKLGAYRVYPYNGDATKWGMEFRGLWVSTHPTEQEAKEAAQAHFEDLLNNPI